MMNEPTKRQKKYEQESHSDSEREEMEAAGGMEGGMKDGLASGSKEHDTHPGSREIAKAAAKTPAN